MSDGRRLTPYTQTQRREAADWFVTIRGEQDPNAESIQAWLRWMNEHEGNRSAFDAVARAWHASPDTSASAMPSAEELSADDYLGEESVEEWLSRQGAARNVAAPRHSTLTAAFARVPRRAWLAAASVIVAGTVLLSLSGLLHPPGVANDRFATGIGEQIQMTLADGSQVWLGPKSDLRVRFDELGRNIELTTGEAFFEVEKERRPFTVRAAGRDIVAVGTAFNVRALDEQVIVDVSEGAVAVTPSVQRASRAPASVRVASGQKLTFRAQEPLETLMVVQSPAPGERARWRDGLLVYRSEPLQAVISDIVRYTDIRIEILDASVGDLRYTGVIYHDAVREWVSALPASFPVTVDSDGSREIIRAR